MIRRSWEARRTPERLAAYRRDNDAGLRAGRNQDGHIRFRLAPFYRADKSLYKGLRGEAILLRVSEVVDYYALWSDVRRFIAAWRPKRVRSPAGQQTADRALADWERSGNDLR